MAGGREENVTDPGGTGGHEPVGGRPLVAGTTGTRPIWVLMAGDGYLEPVASLANTPAQQHQGPVCRTRREHGGSGPGLHAATRPQLGKRQRTPPLKQ